VESSEWANLVTEDGVGGVPFHTDESKKKISLAGTGRKYTKERTRKIQEGRQKNKKEIYEKISLSNKGQKRTLEQSKRISTNKKEKITARGRSNLSQSKQGNKNPAWKGYIKTPDGIFESTMVAAIYYDLTDTAVGRRCKNPIFKGWERLLTLPLTSIIIKKVDLLK